MSKLLLDEKIASDLLKSYNLSVKKIEEKDFPNQKVPDFEVKQNNLLFYSEVKSLELKLDNNAKMFLFRTTFNKLLSQIHKAGKQFDTFNSNGSFPNVLIWISRDFQLNFYTLLDALKGYIEFENQIIYYFRLDDKYKRLKKDFEKIDLHIWLQVSEQNISGKPDFLFIAKKNIPEHFNMLKQIFKFINKS